MIEQLWLFTCDICKTEGSYPSVQAAFNSGWITRNGKDYCSKRCRDSDPPKKEG